MPFWVGVVSSDVHAWHLCCNGLQQNTTEHYNCILHFSSPNLKHSPYFENLQTSSFYCKADIFFFEYNGSSKNNTPCLFVFKTEDWSTIRNSPVLQDVHGVNLFFLALKTKSKLYLFFKLNNVFDKWGHSLLSLQSQLIFTRHPQRAEDILYVCCRFFLLLLQLKCGDTPCCLSMFNELTHEYQMLPWKKMADLHKQHKQSLVLKWAGKKMCPHFKLMRVIRYFSSTMFKTSNGASDLTLKH